MRNALAIFASIALSLTVLGCTQGETSSTDGAHAPTEPSVPTPLDRRPADKTRGNVAPAQTDTLLLAYQDDPDTLNALIANDATSDDFMRWVYEGLGSGDFSDPDKLKPGLAESWTFDPDRLEFTIHLRKGVLWHPMTLPDGRPLPRKEFTARDVQFSYECLLNPHIEAAALRSYFEDPEAKEESEKSKIRLEVVDDYTVKIRWTKPYFLAEQFTFGVPIVPRHVYSVDQNGEPISFDFSSKEFADGFNNHWANTRMCGTGPMMFQEWKRDNRLVLVRNPDYWDQPFYFTQVVFRSIPNVNTSLQNVLRNEMDWAMILEKDMYFQTLEHPRVKEGKVVLKDFAYPGYRYIGYNLRRDLFKDKRVRWALGHCMPVQKIIDEVLKGLAVRVSGPFLPGSSACDETIEPLPFDLEKARALLDEAGWKDTDQDGLRDKVVSGKKQPARFEIIVPSSIPNYLTIASIWKENCRQAGVGVVITPVKWQLMLQKLRQKEFDSAMLGWGTSWSKGDPFQLWHGSQADTPDSSNSIGYVNPQVDKLIEELRVTFDPKRQTEIYHAIHRLIYEDQPYTFLFNQRMTAGYDARLENVRFYKVRPCIDMTEWYAASPRSLAF